MMKRHLPLAALLLCLCAAPAAAQPFAQSIRVPAPAMHEVRIYNGITYCVPSTTPQSEVPAEVYALASQPRPQRSPVQTHQHKNLSRSQTATIQVTYSDTGGSVWTPQAQAAFQYAANLWGSIVTSSQTIKVYALFRPLAPNTLGAAGTTSYFTLVRPGIPANTFFPIALAEAIENGNGNDGEVEIFAEFNSDFTWYYGTDENPPAAQYDFISTVMHELGHGLGFAGAAFFNTSNSQGSIGLQTQTGAVLPVIYDLFTEDINGVSLRNTATYPNPSVALGNALRSTNLFFDGTNARSANGGQAAPIWAPTTFVGGTSYSHLDENVYPQGTANSMMTPFGANGEAVHNPGAVMLGMFKDMFWTVTPLSAAPGASPEAKTFRLEQNYPNPFNPQTNISYELGTAKDVSLKVFDVLGKEVATLVNERKPAGNYSVRFNAAGLASGVYFYRLQAGEATETKKMAVIK